MKCYWFPANKTADNLNSVVIFSCVVIRGVGHWLAPFLHRRSPELYAMFLNGNSQACLQVEGTIDSGRSLANCVMVAMARHEYPLAVTRSTVGNISSCFLSQ